MQSAPMSDVDLLEGVYGAPPPHLARTPDAARQLSPRHPGASDLGAAHPGSYSSIVMQAPPGTVERRHAMAEALSALSQDAKLTALGPNNKGGARLRQELEAFGCVVDETSKSRHRICVALRPALLRGVDDARRAGALRFLEALGLWSQPGLFSWDRIDAGSALLARRLPRLEGHGADLVCGIGYLSLRVLQSPVVTRLDLIDIDRRAIDAARRNVTDPRTHLHWADASGGDARFDKLDFVVMNPPFHSAGAEDKALGQAFIRNAAQMLRAGGVCWLVANRHLPYETALAGAFKSVRLDHDADGFKIYEARA